MWNSLARVCVMAFVTVFAVSLHAAPLSVMVDADGIERFHAPVTVELAVPAQVTLEAIAAMPKPGPALQPGNIPVQIEEVKDEAGKVVKVRLHWVEPALKADEKKTYTLGGWNLNGLPAALEFIDTETTRDLQRGSQMIWRHDVLKYDPAKHVETFKHFHQVYDFHGNGFITQGIGGKQFPHHRGLYMGWAKTGFDGKSYDTWHCTKNVALKHQKFDAARETRGVVMARSVSIANWTTGEDKTILTEDRSLDGWVVGNGLVILDFKFKLTSGGGDVKLDGDPQHAGFQFRAAGEVGESKAKYIYPANVKSIGGDVWGDCAWVVNQFAIKGKPYAVAHFDHPNNPGTDTKKTVYSTRNYGRFGAYASVMLTEAKPLEFNYRILVMDGAVHTEKSVEHFQKLHDGWVKPVKVAVK